MALRVHDLAKELKISSAALMKHLKDMSIEVKSHMKYLDDDVADKVRQKFKQEVEQIKKLETERRMIQEQLRNRDKKEKEIKEQIVDNPFTNTTVSKQDNASNISTQSENSESGIEIKETRDRRPEPNSGKDGFTKSFKEQGKHHPKNNERKDYHEHKHHKKDRPENRDNRPDNREQRPENREQRRDKNDTREHRPEHKEQRKDRHENRDNRSGQRHDSRNDKQNNSFQRLDKPDNRFHSHDQKNKKHDTRNPRPDNRDKNPDKRNERHDGKPHRHDRPENKTDRPENKDKRKEHRTDRPDGKFQRADRPDNREQRPDNREKRYENRGDKPDNRFQRTDRPDNREKRHDNRGDRPDGRFQRTDRNDNRQPRTDSRDQRQGQRSGNFDNRPRHRNENFNTMRSPSSSDRHSPKPLFPKAGIVKPEAKDSLDKQFGKDKVRVVELGDKSKHIQAKLRNTKKKKKEVGSIEIDEAALEKNIKLTLASTKKRKKYKKEDKKDNIEEIHEIRISEFTSVSELAKIIDVLPSEIITRFFQMGKMVSINQRLDRDSLELICAEYDLEIHFQDEFGSEILQDVIDDLEHIDEKPRPPVVTIMGHVDHGKTSILDRIRNTKVAHGESGGITQHIGAYQAIHNEQKVTFIDTPGHEAFTAMRARGANITDVAVIVVAANDGVKPQTIEAIDHARAAGVTLVVAINKIDLPDANVDKTIASLLELNVFLEGYGGQIAWVKCSAIKGDGIDELLEIILLSAEMKELKARFNGPGKGIVLEAEKNAKMGSKATILLQEGVLKKGDNIVVGSCHGHVRKMENELTLELMSIHPADIAVVYGLNDVPKAGDILNVVESEKIARQISSERLQIRQEREKYLGKTNLRNLFTKIKQNEMTDLRLIIKADVDGSMEAVCDSLQKLSGDEIKISIIRKSVGGIIEADVNLASASDAIIIGFNVRANNRAKKLADDTGVEIKYYHIIFEAIDDIKKAMIGMLSPEFKEKILGQALVKQIFKMKKIGTIAGCSVEKGFILAKSSVRLYRDDKVIFAGELGNLKHYQDDVKEVISGTDCGITIKNYNDIKEGDIIESYILEEVERQL
ncbi:MAG: translation initiation factor IF-2 [Candidatus Cloacimonetes bacterium]|nr:translation initiation factor IF-2 [Candidatus Cloacimonadota bacterium]